MADGDISASGQLLEDPSISATGHPLSEGKGIVTNSLSSDEKCYKDTWEALAGNDHAAERGPIDDMDNDTAIADLVAKGTCIPRARVEFVEGNCDYNYKVIWNGTAGRSLVFQRKRILSDKHPWIDGYQHPFVVVSKQPNRMFLKRTRGEGPENVDTHTWRVYLQTNSDHHKRMVTAIRYFVSRQTWPLQRIIVNDHGSRHERGKANSIAASAAGQAPVNCEHVGRVLRTLHALSDAWTESTRILSAISPAERRAASRRFLADTGAGPARCGQKRRWLLNSCVQR